MSQNSIDTIEEIRMIASKLYINWLIENDILSKFSRPETLPSVFYQKNLSTQDYTIVESILRFLIRFNVFQEAGGTFVLKNDIDIIKKRISLIKIKDYKHHSVRKFIEYGLSLLDQKLEGGAGEWDIPNFGYYFERGLTNSINMLMSSQIDQIFNIQRIKALKPKLNIAIYSFYPEEYIQAIISSFNINRIDLVFPTKILLDKGITYCDFMGITDKIGNFLLKDNIPRGMKYDLFVFPNGVEFYHPINDHLKFIKPYLVKGGFLYMGLANNEESQLGIEPLFATHPVYVPPPTAEDIVRFVRSNGYSTPKPVGPMKYFYETTKEE